MMNERHTIVFSDFHLPSAAAEGDGVWMRYRSSRFFIDGSFSALAERLVDRLSGAPFEVVFDGDTFELDGADGYRGNGDRACADVGDEAGERDSLQTILDDHPLFVAATGRLLAHADRIVFVAGNHDLGLYWPGVQALLTARLVAAALEADPGLDPATVAERIVYRQWFYRTGDGVLVEHGHQYDAASSSPDALVPRRGDGDGLWLSLGSVGFRHVLGHVGTMNPHTTASFVLGLGGYFRHYYQYYFRKGRAIFRRTGRGLLRVVQHAWAQRRSAAAPPPSEAEEAFRALREEANDLPPGTLSRLRSLHQRPAMDNTYRYLRDLRLDWVLLGGLLALMSLAAVLVIPWPWDFAATLLVAGTFWGYERLAPSIDYEAYEEGLVEVADAVGRLTHDDVIVTGHTHNPGAWPLAGGGVLINTGAWAPGFVDPECRRAVSQARSFAWIRTFRQIEARPAFDPLASGIFRSAERLAAERRTIDARLLLWDGGEIVAYRPPDEHVAPPSLPPLPSANDDTAPEPRADEWERVA